MAIMASPTPDVSADLKSRDSVPEKEQKPELNGHAPAADTKTESESPKVNGTAKEEGNHVNGVSEDVKMEKSEESKPPASPTKEAVTKVETEETKSKSEDPAPVPTDVEMSDAAPANDDADHSESKVEPESKPADEASEDAEMTDKPVDKPAEDATTEKVNGNTDAPPSSDPLPGSEVDLQPNSLSQLAIESETTAKPSIEVAMQDAPGSDSAPSVKVAREREDDTTDEPAPKRARTEPQEEETVNVEPASSSAPADAASSQPSGLSSLSKWDDSEINSQKLTPYQRREFRKVLGRVKKTKQGMHFRDSVQRLWPVLWDSYAAKIEKPTDLSGIDRTLRDPAGLYKTMGDFKQDLLLMYENTLSFNGPAHDVTQAAKGCIRNIWEDVLTIPQEEPAKPKAAPKQKPLRESRAAAHPEPVTKKSSAGPASPALEAPPKSAPTQDQPSSLRRASTATEGDRPKRTVRPPKAKDIDYSTKPSRKKMKPELQFCEEVLNELMAPKNKLINQWFMEAVDAEGLAIPQYYSIIKKPMDLGKVQRMLANGDITNSKDFNKNVRLIFDNCYTFNGTPDQNSVSFVAKQLEDIYNAKMKQKDSWLANHAKANAPPPASNASDDEDEEDEIEDVASSGADHAKEVRELEAKLREESEKLNDLFAADSPNSALINVQQGILRMVQEALLTAKTTQSEFRQKNEKASKKSKPSKSKASGGAARKPSNAAHPKKSGGTKKAVKKNLSAADKDAIANAINDLEYPHLDRAIDIIKRDTGQNENNQGELELDIDQLSNEALLKLWELCKKVLPGFGKDSAPAPDSSPEISRAAPGKSSAKNATKPKKNKPMSAREQEERIAQLRGLRDLYRPGTDGPDGQNVSQASMPADDSSDDSDSEEE